MKILGFLMDSLLETISSLPIYFYFLAVFFGLLMLYRYLGWFSSRTLFWWLIFPALIFFNALISTWLIGDIFGCKNINFEPTRVDAACTNVPVWFAEAYEGISFLLAIWMIIIMNVLGFGLLVFGVAKMSRAALHHFLQVER